MKRWGWGIAVLLALLAVVGGYLVYRDYRGVQELGQEVYHELEYDGVPPPPGLADDPLFATLPPPPPERPLSLGRYRAPEGTAPSPAPLPEPQPLSEPQPEPVEPEATAAEPEVALPVSAAPQAAPEVGPTVPSGPAEAPGGAAPVVPASPPPPLAAPEPTPSAPPEPDRAPAPAAVPLASPVAPERPAAPPRPAPPVTPASPGASPEASPVAAPVTRPTPPVPTVAVPPAPRYVGGTFLERIRTPARIRVLLIGTDQETLGRGRADVLLLLTFDPVDRTLRLLSIPRDTLITLPGRGAVKINAAYALGGPSLQTEAVERLLGLATDKYVEISLGGFREAVDLLGGVTVNPPFAFSLDGFQFAPGSTRLGGDAALAYTRARRGDPEGDFGRNRRQQEVVRALMAALSDLPPGDLLPLIGELSEHLRTNFSPSEVVELRRVHDYATSRQQSVGMQGRGEVRGGVWYFIVGDRERQRLHLLLR